MKHSMQDAADSLEQILHDKAYHTPGTWSVKEWPEGILTIEADGVRIAEVADDHNDERGISETVRANAALLVAAPALLALLTEARKWMDGDLVGDAWDKKFLKRVDGLLSRARGR